MKPGELLRLVAIVVIAGGTAFFVAQHFAPETPPADEVAWVIEEFKLTSDQAEKVRALHEAYRPVCDAHCAAVMEAQTAWDEASGPAQRTAAEQELMELKHRCHAATRAHLETVAAVMSPEQGQRYLETISPLLSAHEHTAPFGLR